MGALTKQTRGRKWGELPGEAAQWRSVRGGPRGPVLGGSGGQLGPGCGRPLCVPALAPPCSATATHPRICLQASPRPDFGTSGRAIKLQANFFEMDIPKGDIYHCRLDISNAGELTGILFCLSLDEITPSVLSRSLGPLSRREASIVFFAFNVLVWRYSESTLSSAAQ